MDSEQRRVLEESVVSLLDLGMAVNAETGALFSLEGSCMAGAAQGAMCEGSQKYLTCLGGQVVCMEGSTKSFWANRRGRY